MKLLEFKNLIKERFDILRINIINTYQIETAFIGNNWGNMLSTLFYTLSYILFINVIFANVRTFAGYSKNEILFLTLIGQLSFFFIWMFSITNAKELIQDVNSGNLDMILTKPLPSLFYVSTKKISFIGFLRDGFATIAILCFLINWTNLNLNLVNLISGIIIFIFGQIAFNGFQFLFALPVFWFGESTSIHVVSYSFVDSSVPYEGYTKVLRLIFSTIMPVLITSLISTSVMLGKSNPMIMTPLAVIIGITFLFIKSAAWRFALKNYTSASS